MAASFSSPDPDAGQPGHAAAVDAVVGRHADQHLFQVAHVAVHVAAIGLQVDDRVADDLAGAVVGDVAAAAGLVHLDAARGQRLGGRENVRSAAVAAHAERQDVRMLDEQQQIADAARAPLLDERALQRQRVGVRHEAEPPDLERVAQRVGAAPVYGRYARRIPVLDARRLMCDMNSSATAPSMIRWS